MVYLQSLQQLGTGIQMKFNVGTESQNGGVTQTDWRVVRMR